MNALRLGGHTFTGWWVVSVVAAVVLIWICLSRTLRVNRHCMSDPTEKTGGVDWLRSKKGLVKVRTTLKAVELKVSRYETLICID